MIQVIRKEMLTIFLFYHISLKDPLMFLLLTLFEMNMQLLRYANFLDMKGITTDLRRMSILAKSLP